MNRGVVKWESKAPLQRSRVPFRVQNLQKISAISWIRCSSSCSWSRSNLLEKAYALEEKTVISCRKICMSSKRRWRKKCKDMLVNLRSNQRSKKESKNCVKETHPLKIKFKNCFHRLLQVKILGINKCSVIMSKIHLF